MLNAYGIYQILLRGCKRKVFRCNVNNFLHHPGLSGVSGYSVRTMEPTKNIFVGEVDRFEGITVDSDKEPCHANEFSSKLEASLEQWTARGTRAVWFRVGLLQAEWVPQLAHHGFTFHHVHNGRVLMTRWLPPSPSALPPYAHTVVGVGAVVMHNDSLLVVRERFYKRPHWKLPGGYVEPGEDLCDAAHREVLEETGINTNFQFVVMFRHAHQAAFGCSDLYFIVSLKPTSTVITKCEREIDACEWMKVEEFLNHPHVHETNRFVVRKFLECQEQGSFVSCQKTMHPLLKKPQCLYAIEFSKHTACGEQATGSEPATCHNAKS